MLELVPGYFAYGSNMCSHRLRTRVGEVRVVGRVHLPGYEHGFTKLGTDGTGKGNIERRDRRVVHGVLYQLSDRQFEVLAGFETGYVQREVATHVWGSTHVARTFVAEPPTGPLEPSPEYLTHYLRGMDEHGLPGRWRRIILRASGIRPPAGWARRRD